MGSHWLQQVEPWGPGDANGDGAANSADAAILAADWDTDFTSWPLGEDRVGDESKESIRRDLQVALDALFARYDLDAADDSGAAEWEDGYWDQFIDDFLGIFSDLAA